MSFTALNWAWDQNPKTGIAKFVLVYLANCSNSEEGESAWPSVDDIVLKVKHGEVAVRKAIKELVTDKYIEIAPRKASNGRQKSNRYILLMRENVTAGASPTPSNSRGSNLWGWDGRDAPVEGVRPACSTAAAEAAAASAEADAPPTPTPSNQGGVSPSNQGGGSLSNSRENPLCDTLRDKQESLPSVAPPARARKPAARGTSLPDDWVPCQQSIELGASLGMDAARVAVEAQRMRDWALFKGVTGSGWDRRFANWLREEDRRDRRAAPWRGGGRAPVGKSGEPPAFDASKLTGFEALAYRRGLARAAKAENDGNFALEAAHG